MTGERNHHADCVTDVGAEACKSLFFFSCGGILILCSYVYMKT